MAVKPDEFSPTMPVPTPTLDATFQPPPRPLSPMAWHGMVKAMKHRLVTLIAVAAITVTACTDDKTNDTPASTPDNVDSTTTTAETADDLSAGQQAVQAVVPYLPAGLGPDFPVAPLIDDPGTCADDPAIPALSCALPDQTFLGPDGDPTKGIIIANVEDGFAALTSENGTIWCAAARGITTAYGEGETITAAIEDCTHPNW